MKLYFEYAEKETSYLKSKDKRLGEVIDRVGPIYREVDPDLFFFRYPSYYRTTDFDKSTSYDLETQARRTRESEFRDDTSVHEGRTSVFWKDIPKSGVHQRFC